MGKKTLTTSLVFVLVIAMFAILPQEAFALPCPDPDQTFLKAPPVITSITPTTDGAVVTWEQSQLHAHILFFFHIGCFYPDFFEVEVALAPNPVTTPNLVFFAGGLTQPTNDGGTFTITGLLPNTDYNMQVDAVWNTFLFGGKFKDSATSSFKTLAIQKGGDDCSNCTPPTIGQDTRGHQLVQNGFECNGTTIHDVTFYKSHMDLVILGLDQTLDCYIKVYDDQGVANIRAIDLALGKKKIGESLSMSEQKISWRQTFNGIESVTFDTETFKDVMVMKMDGLVPCRDDSTDSKCGFFNFRATVISPIVGDVVVGVGGWDAKGNMFTTFLNEGIQVGTESDLPQLVEYVIPQGTGNRPQMIQDESQHCDQRWSVCFQERILEERNRINQLIS